MLKRPVAVMGIGAAAPAPFHQQLNKIAVDAVSAAGLFISQLAPQSTR